MSTKRQTDTERKIDAFKDLQREVRAINTAGIDKMSLGTLYDLVALTGLAARQHQREAEEMKAAGVSTEDEWRVQRFQEARHRTASALLDALAEIMREDVHHRPEGDVLYDEHPFTTAATHMLSRVTHVMTNSHVDSLVSAAVGVDMARTRKA